MKMVRLNNPLRGYIRPTDRRTGIPTPILARRIVAVTPSGRHTLIDCGQCAGFETYLVREPLQKVLSMIQDALS